MYYLIEEAFKKKKKEIWVLNLGCLKEHNDTANTALSVIWSSTHTYNYKILNNNFTEIHASNKYVFQEDNNGKCVPFV